MELTCRVGQRDSYFGWRRGGRSSQCMHDVQCKTFACTHPAGSGLQLAGSGLRPAHGIGCDSLSSRSGESGLPEAWDPASPELAPLHEQAPLKQAISQVAMTCAGPLCTWLQPLMIVLNRLIAL